MRRRIIGILIVVIVFSTTALGFCQENSYMKTVKLFYKCLEEGKPNKMMKETLTPHVAKVIKNGSNPSKLGGDLGAGVLVADYKGKGELNYHLSNFKFKVDKPDKGMVKVVARYKVTHLDANWKEKESEMSLDTFVLKKINNRWLIDKMIQKVDN